MYLSLLKGYFLVRQKKKRRYSKGTRTKEGYRSKLETHFAKELGKRKIPILYETEKLPYKKDYIPDFIINTKSGKKIYVEVKGWFKSEDRTKMLAVKQANPTLDIRMFFSSDNKLYKNSKTRYSDWCEQHGFPYAIKDIPKEWFR